MLEQRQLITLTFDSICEAPHEQKVVWEEKCHELDAGGHFKLHHGQEVPAL